MKKEISLSDIRTFVIIVETGSFTNAANLVMCSRSHISKQLSQLESDLGVTLLIRTTRTQKLTPQGETFYERCRISLQCIDQAIERVVESSESLGGVIKVNSVGGLIGESIVSQLVCDFMNKYPDISIELDFSSRRVDLISGEFDFVFRMGELENSALIARKLFDLKIDIFASPSYLEKYNHPSSPKELNQHRCIAGSMHHWSFVNKLNDKKYEIAVNGNLKCSNGRVMVTSALSGHGIIRVPELYCLQEINSGELVRVFNEWKVQSTPLYLVYVQNKHQPPRLKKFKEFVVENYNHYVSKI